MLQNPRVVDAMVLLFALAAVGGGHPVFADLYQCNDPLLLVEVDGKERSESICKLATDLRDDLGRCGLIQTERLTIEFVPTVSHPNGSCLSYFDCDYDLIRITEPGLYAELLDETEPYALLPGQVLLKALLTHELSHALAFQSAGTRKIEIVDQEYIAASMELELMEPVWRETLIAAAPVTLPPKDGLIDIWIYGLEPRKFATNAWQHFRLSDNGCDLVQKIVRGEVTFKKR